jgi:hypothetical protein
MMKTDFKKLDDEEVIFLNEPWTPEERKEFSAFLKARKEKREQVQKGHSIKRPIHHPKVHASK